MNTINQTTLTFPEIRLPVREAHRLRGYFGNLFREHSPLLHNHYADGRSMYRYPLVQYKVIGGMPVLLGLGEGAELLMRLFLDIKELKIGEQTFDLTHKQIKCRQAEVSVGQDLYEYRFETLYMALVQKNYRRYTELPQAERPAFLNKLLCNHLLAVYKGLDSWPKERIMVKARLEERMTNFKNQRMTVFGGSFVTNALLPDLIGTGKSVSRGYGTVRRINS